MLRYKLCGVDRLIAIFVLFDGKEIFVGNEFQSLQLLFKRFLLLLLLLPSLKTDVYHRYCLLLGRFLCSLPCFALGFLPRYHCLCLMLVGSLAWLCGRRACLRQPRVSGARIDCPTNAPKTSDCYFVAITGANFQFVGQKSKRGRPLR